MANRQGSHAGALFLIALGVSAMASAQTPPSLYARLGGTQGVTAFVGDAIDKLAANPQMNQSFNGVNVQHVKDVLAARICTLAGGGCIDSGARLRELHAGHRIGTTEFSSLVETLRESMRTHDVPLAARNQLLEILGPTNRDAVNL